MDWGLGHATRCIPIIHELNRTNANVIVAATGAVKALLQQEFPGNRFVSIPPYNIKYAQHSKMLIWQLILQIPRIIIVILKENRVLKRLVREHSIDVVISDNRFGLFHSRSKTIYVTHQLSFETGNTTINRIASSIHHWFIKKYSQCWVPDFSHEPLAGNLSRTSKKIKQLHYIGCLSRFKKLDHVEKKYDLLVLISGPEPQRTSFESMILSQLQNYCGEVIIIRGLPGNQQLSENKPWHKQNIVFKNHVNAQELAVLIQQSNLVICRSGYTSIMDLVKIKQRAILIPTPHQPEQEYLARYLLKGHIFYSIQEKDFLLDNAIQDAHRFPFLFPESDMSEYVRAISDLLTNIEIKERMKIK